MRWERKDNAKESESRIVETRREVERDERRKKSFLLVCLAPCLSVCLEHRQTQKKKRTES